MKRLAILAVAAGAIAILASADVNASDRYYNQFSTRYPAQNQYHANRGVQRPSAYPNQYFQQNRRPYSNQSVYGQFGRQNYHSPSVGRWHDTTHFDYHPGSFQRHRNHFHYVPGHYDIHRSGHRH